MIGIQQCSCLSTITIHSSYQWIGRSGHNAIFVQWVDRTFRSIELLSYICIIDRKTHINAIITIIIYEIYLATLMVAVLLNGGLMEIFINK